MHQGRQFYAKNEINTTFNVNLDTPNSYSEIISYKDTLSKTRIELKELSYTKDEINRLKTLDFWEKDTQEYKSHLNLALDSKSSLIKLTKDQEKYINALKEKNYRFKIVENIDKIYSGMLILDTENNKVYSLIYDI